MSCNNVSTGFLFPSSVFSLLFFPSAQKGFLLYMCLRREVCGNPRGVMLHVAKVGGTEGMTPPVLTASVASLGLWALATLGLIGGRQPVLKAGSPRSHQESWSPGLGSACQSTSPWATSVCTPSSALVGIFSPITLASRASLVVHFSKIFYQFAHKPVLILCIFLSI